MEVCRSNQRSNEKIHGGNFVICSVGPSLPTMSIHIYSTIVKIRFFIHCANFLRHCNFFEHLKESVNMVWFESHGRVEY